jgi:hypothetical protein
VCEHYGWCAICNDDVPISENGMCASCQPEGGE